ncbi:hypothetical protein AB6C58_20385, partial [Vibrio splendidus]
NLPVISSIFITVIDCTQVLDIEPRMNMKERRVKDNRVSILSGEDHSQRLAFSAYFNLSVYATMV